MWNKIFIVGFLSLCLICPQLVKSQYSEFANIPNDKLILVWESACMKHLKEKNLNRAWMVLETMNWQCANREYLTIAKRDMAEFEENLNNAGNLMVKYKKDNKPWLCYVPKQPLMKMKKDFYEKVGGLIERMLKEKKVNNEMIYAVIAQSIHETSWGTQLIDDNLFNVKGNYNKNSIKSTTHEYLPNKTKIKLATDFRLYSSSENSISDYLNQLKKNWKQAYDALFVQDANIELFAESFKSGKLGIFATDPNYADDLIQLYYQVKREFGPTLYPTYLSCLGRKSELERIKNTGGSHE